jgi:hypothetical protein
VARGSSGTRSDLYLHAYYQLGATRSIRRLQAQLAASGIHTSIGTLKRLSVRFDWQARLAELDAEARNRQREQDVAGTMAMHDRHAQLGRAMQGAAGSALQRLLANDARLSGLKPSDIARLIELGLRAERSAVGVASDRRDIALEVCNDVVIIIARLFLEINEEPDARTRARLFARRLDRVIDERLAQYEREV